MAKPGREKEPLTFRAWLEHPELYVRRGELVQIVERVILIHAKKNQSWWQTLKDKFKGA